MRIHQRTWWGMGCVWLLMLATGHLSADEPSFRVSGYLPDYRTGAVAAQVSQSLSDLIVFSIEVQPDGSLNEKRWGEEHWAATRSIRSRPGLRTHVCVGGWDRSAGFAEICQSPTVRQRLGHELVKYCRQHALAGVNIDWEHPSTATEQSGLTLLLSELQTRLHSAKIEMSIAVAPSQKLPPEAWSAVDQVMLMSYDDAGKHSTFESTQKHLGMLLDQGVPAAKIILCLPLYGRQIENREALTYAQIVEKYAPRPDQDEVAGVYFNGPGTIAAKTAWAQAIGLGGVAVWELGQDAPGEASLLKLI